MKAAVLYELNQPVVVEDIEMEGPEERRSPRQGRRNGCLS